MKVPKRSLQVVTLIAVFLISAGGTLLLLRSHNPSTIHEGTQSVIPPLSAEEKAEDAVPVVPGLPVRLKIPKINVDAAIEGLGLTPQGDLDAPDGPDNAGWYDAGPRPGAVGSAVLDGHYGWVNNKPAVFDNLHTLQKGDVLYVEDEKKVTYTFVVSELRSYRPEDDASAVFRSSDSGTHLNLITCQGTWNKNQESYSTRLVVFADMLRE